MTNAPILTAEAIIFAINSAIRLSRTIRKAYARSIKGKLLVLPLPAFDPSLDLITIVAFFRANPQYTRQIKELNILHQRAFTTPNFRSDIQAFERYQEYYYAFSVSNEQAELTQEDIIHLMAVRQWQRGVEEPSSVLQLVAGTLVELGIDYFLQVPGAANPNTAKGKILREFLEAFDQIDFTVNPNIKKTLSERLLPRLFAAAAESIAALSPDISSDEKLQFFIRETAHGIAQDMYNTLEKIPDPFEQEKAIHWGQAITRSMINNAGIVALANPSYLFDTNVPVSQMIESTGGLLLKAILDDESDKVYFKNALSTQLLDDIVKASLEVVAAHPNVISGEKGIKQIVAGIATTIKEDSLFEQGYFPELVRIVLEQSAGYLPLLWSADEENGEHLLILAVQQILNVLSQKHGDYWRPAFTKEDTLDLIYELLDEVVSNPSWVTDKVEEESILARTLDISFEALQHIDKRARLNADVIRWLIRLNIRTVVLSPKVLDQVKWGEEEEVIILERALELVFTFIFPQDAPHTVNQIELFTTLTEYILETVIRHHPNKKGLIILDIILFDSGIQYQNGFNEDLLDELTAATLDALANHPGLVVKHEGLKQILADLAAAIDSADLQKPGLLPFLVPLILRHTAANAHLIIVAEEDQPRHLLLTASQMILEALSANDVEGNWEPELTDDLAQQLIIELLDETVRNPHWVAPRPDKHPILQEMLDITFWVLERIDKKDRLSGETLQLLIQLNTQLVLTSPQVLDLLKWGVASEHKAAILEHALYLVFDFVFPKEGSHTEERALLLTALLEYVLSVVLFKHPNKKGLILIDLILFEENGIDYSQGFNEQLVDDLIQSALLVLNQYPDLVSKEEAVVGIVGGIAGALSNSGLERPDILPELLRLTLEQTAQHLYLIYEVDKDDPRHLLVLAAEQTLMAIADEPRAGKWKPRLTNEQITEILEMVYHAVLANPQWIQQEPLIFLLLEAIFRALEVIPSHRILPFNSISLLIHYAMEAASRQRELVLKIQVGDQANWQIRLRYSLEEIFIVIYEEHDTPEARWYLSQAYVIESLIDYIFLLLSESGTSKEELDQITEHIRLLMQTWMEDFTRTLSEVLDLLDEGVV
jgi:hypothetical protein